MEEIFKLNMSRRTLSRDELLNLLDEYERNLFYLAAAGVCKLLGEFGKANEMLVLQAKLCRSQGDFGGAGELYEQLGMNSDAISCYMSGVDYENSRIFGKDVQKRDNYIDKIKKLLN